MFIKEYHLPLEFLKAATKILFKNRLEQLDTYTACNIQPKAYELRKASEDMVNSSIGKYLFLFLFDISNELFVSKNTKWTDTFNILL